MSAEFCFQKNDQMLMLLRDANVLLQILGI